MLRSTGLGCSPAQRKSAVAAAAPPPPPPSSSRLPPAQAAAPWDRPSSSSGPNSNQSIAQQVGNALDLMCCGLWRHSLRKGASGTGAWPWPVAFPAGPRCVPSRPSVAFIAPRLVSPFLVAPPCGYARGFGHPLCQPGPASSADC